MPDCEKEKDHNYLFLLTRMMYKPIKKSPEIFTWFEAFFSNSLTFLPEFPDRLGTLLQVVLVYKQMHTISESYPFLLITWTLSLNCFQRWSKFQNLLPCPLGRHMPGQDGVHAVWKTDMPWMGSSRHRSLARFKMANSASCFLKGVKCLQKRSKSVKMHDLLLTPVVTQEVKKNNLCKNGRCSSLKI